MPSYRLNDQVKVNNGWAVTFGTMDGFMDAAPIRCTKWPSTAAGKHGQVKGLKLVIKYEAKGLTLRSLFRSWSRLVDVMNHLVDGRLGVVRLLVRVRQPVTMTTSTQRYYGNAPVAAEHEVNELVSVQQKIIKHFIKISSYCHPATQPYMCYLSKDPDCQSSKYF